MNTLNPSFYLGPDQIWPAFSDCIQAVGHHIISHGRIWATSEPARSRFPECLLDLFTVSMRSQYATSVLIKTAYVFEARIQRTCDQFGIDDGKNGPKQRAEKKWCLSGDHRENESVNQERHE